MKLKTLALTVIVTGATTAVQYAATEPAGIAGQVLKIFRERCIECHGNKAEDTDEFAFIDDLAQLRTSEYINLTNPPASKLYRLIQSGEMPRRTKADKEAGKKKADPLTEEQVSTVLTWLNAGAPDGMVATPPAVTGAAAAPAKVTRKLVTPREELTAALADIQNVPHEEQADTRYVSLASAHNNVSVTAEQLENLRRGVRKLLNSLSTGPRAALFDEVGPEKVLFRVRLREIGWDAELWDNVAVHFPQSIDTGVNAALGSACNATVPILRADWMAAVATRPPLYHDILRLPKQQQDLEKGFGVDLIANLQAGEAVRSGLLKSGISLANRVVERHEMRSRAGYYWASYDFRSSSGRGNILDFPLGPEKAHLAGAQHAFKQAGGEFVFSLPNGFHGYYLADVQGNRLDGAAPTDIVGDRTGVTGRVEVSNGFSCIVCHDRGIKPIDTPDAVRAVASRFSADEQHLIERLYPAQEKFAGFVEADTERFVSAIKTANAGSVAGQPEPLGALAKLFDGEVSVETAAAEIGLSPENLSLKLEDQAQLFVLKTSFKGGGTILREHFLDYFPDLVRRLDIGIVRGAQAIASVPLSGRLGRPKPIAIELKTDKTTYREGEKLIVTIQAAESGHLRLLYENAAGEVYTLFPNQLLTDDRIEGGKPVRVIPTSNPGRAGQEVNFTITGPNFGVEHLAAIVTDQPFSDEAGLKEELKEEQFSRSDRRDIERAITKDIRGVSHTEQENGSGSSRVGLARVTLTTIRN